jgi:hypothetical protein
MVRDERRGRVQILESGQSDCYIFKSKESNMKKMNKTGSFGDVNILKSLFPDCFLPVTCLK